MNLLTITANLVGDSVTDSGLRVLEVHLPLFGKNGGHAPLFVVPSMAAGETFGAFAPNTQLLINGRLYPNRNDNKMYVVPNQPLQAVPKEVNLNQVNLAGGIGYVNDPKMEELFECSIMVKAPSNKLLNHSWQTSMGFRLEGWQEDARRMRSLFYKGRQIAVGGSLRYSSWKSEDGVQKGYYSIRVRSQQYSVFGKNQLKVEEPTQAATPTPNRPPLQQDLAPCSLETDDGLPF
jgi:hypothetical protein